MITLTVILFLLLFTAIIYGLTVLRRRQLNERMENDKVYDDAIKMRYIKGSEAWDLYLDLPLKKPEDSLLDEPNVIDCGYDFEFSEEPEDSLITYRDLTDIDEIQSGHMIF